MIGRHDAVGAGTGPDQGGAVGAQHRLQDRQQIGIRHGRAARQRDLALHVAVDGVGLVQDVAQDHLDDVADLGLLEIELHAVAAPLRRRHRAYRVRPAREDLGLQARLGRLGILGTGGRGRLTPRVWSAAARRTRRPAYR